MRVVLLAQPSRNGHAHQGLCKRPVNAAWRTANRWHADRARAESGKKNEESLGRGGGVGRLPAVRQEFIEAAHRPRPDPRQHVRDVGKRVHAVPLARGHQAGRRRPGPPPPSFPRKRESRTRRPPGHPRARQGPTQLSPPPPRHSRASGNPRQGGLSRHSRGRQGPTRPPAGGRGARPVGTRGVSLDPRLRGGDDTGHDGSSRAPTRALRHSRASGNPGEVGSARPPGPRHVSPSRTSARILANPRRRKQDGVHWALTLGRRAGRAVADLRPHGGGGQTLARHPYDAGRSGNTERAAGRSCPAG